MDFPEEQVPEPERDVSAEWVATRNTRRVASPQVRELHKLLDAPNNRADRVWYIHLLDLVKASSSSSLVQRSQSKVWPEKLAPDSCVVARDYPVFELRDGKRKYARFKISEVYDRLMRVDRDARVWYWMLSLGTHMHIVFDFDCEHEGHPLFAMEDLGIARRVTQLFSEWASETLRRSLAKGVVLQSSTPRKRSLHFHFQMEGAVFRDMGDLTRAIFGFVSWCYERRDSDSRCRDMFLVPGTTPGFTGSNWESLVDVNALMKNRLMRIWHCQKVAKGNWLERVLPPVPSSESLFDRITRAAGSGDDRSVFYVACPYYNPPLKLFEDDDDDASAGPDVINHPHGYTVPHREGVRDTNVTGPYGMVGVPIFGPVPQALRKAFLYESAIVGPATVGHSVPETQTLSRKRSRTPSDNDDDDTEPGRSTLSDYQRLCHTLKAATSACLDKTNK